MNKAAFMNELTKSLSEYGVNDSREILLDFEQHFEDGKAAGETEDEVCEKLGDPVEIAKQYVEEEGYQFDVFFDTQSEAVYTYYVTAFPTTYFIDSDGNLVAQGNGMLDYATIEKGIKMITEQ